MSKAEIARLVIPLIVIVFAWIQLKKAAKQ